MTNSVKNSTINNLEKSFWLIEGDSCHWSLGFLKILKVKTKKASIDFKNFSDNFLKKEDKSTFINNYYGFLHNDISFKQIVRIKNKEGKYKEFIANAENEPNEDTSEVTKIISFDKKRIKTEKKVSGDNFYYRETLEMTDTGSWYIDFLKHKSYWDSQARKILEYPEDYIPSLSKAMGYYAPEHQKKAMELFTECGISGKAFDCEIKMITANNRKIWVKAIGKPVYNKKQEITGIRGVFQNIDESKIKELTLKKTSDIIASQNSRLFNFAHIVSHNLRSHTSNLSLVLELINEVESPKEKLELFDSIKDISKSLNTTIEHLNEVVTIQTKTYKSKVETHFDDALNIVKTSIGHILNETKSTIISNFDELKYIDYIPAYLESILLNLITNSIKYKHPERHAIIHIKSYIEGDKKYLMISDNGIGIDMEKFGDKLFGMYKTFHRNSDAVGIGLFITKNQIESLDGEIFVESEVDKGTTFKIKFN